MVVVVFGVLFVLYGVVVCVTLWLRVIVCWRCVVGVCCCVWLEGLLEGVLDGVDCCVVCVV